MVYAIWNMFNDPIIGYISDKPRRWWPKWGKRRPWIMASIIPWGLTFLLLFTVPNFNPTTSGGAVSLFMWLVVTSIVYDTFFSIFGTNFNGLLPEKFRTDAERRRQASIGIAFSTVGMVLGTTLPGLFGSYQNQYSWILGAAAISVVGIAFGMLMGPGTKEPPDMIERAEFCVEEEIEHEKCKNEKSPFFDTLRKILRDKNYVAYLILIVCYQCLVLLMVGTIPYLNRFILKPAPVEPESLLFVPPIIVGLLSIPFWHWITKKIGNAKMVILGGTLIICSGLPFLFISNTITIIVFISIMGLGQIAFGLQLMPILAEVVDELVVKIGKRQEGLVIGVRTFFARFGLIIQAITFGLIHILTGFEPASTTQDPLALIGLRIQLALVPTIIMTIGILLFWRMYDIDPTKKKTIQRRLAKLKL